MPPELLPVWLDCDPGHDDALAIILAAYTPGLRLLGISTCHGNQTLAKTTANAKRVLAMAGIADVCVVPGAARPLLRAPRVCEEIHGDSGLDGPDVALHAHLDAQAAEPITEAAVVYMHRALLAAHASCGRATLVCTGALTNAALLVSVFPELVPLLSIVFMGGAMGAGNTGPVAEFNVQLDPEAASIVMDCGAEVLMVPLEVTHTALVTPAVLARIRSGGGSAAAESDATALAPAAPPSEAASRFRRIICELLLFFAASYKRVFSFDSPPLHDPCAVAAALRPELFMLRRMRVDVETVSPLSAGQTVCDVWGHSALPPNVVVATAMDVPAFWALMQAALDAADARSPLNAGAA